MWPSTATPLTPSSPSCLVSQVFLWRLNVDGIERKRKKWNRLAKAWYHLSEYLSTIFPNTFVTDAEAIRVYYREHYGKESLFIPYGADTKRVATCDMLHQLGLQAHRYFLYVSRLEPENRALEVRLAYERSRQTSNLLLSATHRNADEYIRQVRNTTDPRHCHPGAILWNGYKELGSWCFAYIHATEVGGTHPALIEAMGRGCLVLYLDNSENREVAGDAGTALSRSGGALLLVSAKSSP